MIISGLDTKVNLRVLIRAYMLNYILFKQYPNETNDAYLIRFKSMVETLKIAGREHILVSTTLLGREIKNSTVAEINAEKDEFMAICYILRSNEVRYKKTAQ